MEILATAVIPQESGDSFTRAETSLQDGGRRLRMNATERHAALCRDIKPHALDGYKESNMELSRQMKAAQDHVFNSFRSPGGSKCCLMFPFAIQTTGSTGVR